MNPKIVEAVGRLPGPDEHGLMSVIDKQTVDEVTEAIVQAAPQGIVDVVDMLRPPGQGDDHKAHYALHCVAIAVGKAREAQRRTVSEALCKCLDSDYPSEVKEYLIGQLQVVGGVEAAATLCRFLADEGLCDSAARALTAIGAGAIEQFEQALPAANDKCRPIIMQNLDILKARKK